MTQLPADWDERPLSHVARLSSGGTPQAKNPMYYGGDIPWAVIGDLNDGVVRQTAQAITQAGLDSSSAKIVPAGTVLIGMYGSIGKLGIAGTSMSTNQAIATIQASDELDNRYLFYYLLAQRRDLDRQGKGATQRNISQTILKPWPIRFPRQIDEQRRIVDLLEDHLSRLDAAENYLTSGFRRAKVWHQQVLTNTLWSADHPRAPVGEMLREPMRNGRSDRPATGDEAGIRSLTLTAVTKNAFTHANTKVTATAPERARDLWLEPGDVFVQRSNTPELVGTTARYDGPREWAIFPDLLIRLRTDEDRIDSRFLAAALQSRPGHDQLRRKAKGLAGSMPKIDQSAIAGTTIPLPPVDVQQQMLAIIEDAAGALKLLGAEMAAAQSRSRVLRRALLEAAFSGRLTSNHQLIPDSEELAQ